MNAKQALKKVAAQLEDAEHYNMKCKADIVAYNQCIESMIKGGSPCEWCEEKEECQLQAKADGKGCEQWWLKY